MIVLVLIERCNLSFGGWLVGTTTFAVAPVLLGRVTCLAAVRLSESGVERVSSLLSVAIQATLSFASGVYVGHVCQFGLMLKMARVIPLMWNQICL